MAQVQLDRLQAQVTPVAQEQLLHKRLRAAGVATAGNDAQPLSLSLHVPLPATPTNPQARAPFLSPAIHAAHSSAPFARTDPPASADPAAAASAAASSSLAAAASAHQPAFANAHHPARAGGNSSSSSSALPIPRRKRVRSEADGEEAALHFEALQLRAEHEQHAGHNASAAAAATPASVAAFSSNSTPSPAHLAPVLHMSFPSPQTQQSPAAQQQQQQQQQGFAPTRAMSIEDMQSQSRLQAQWPLPAHHQLSSSHLGASLARQREQYEQHIATSYAAAAASVPVTAVPSSAWTLPALVDASVLNHLQQHVPVLPATMPGISVEVIALMLLWQMPLSSLPAGVPVSSAVFLAGLQSKGCTSDAHLQHLLQKLLADFAAPVAPPVSSSSLAPRPCPPFKSFYLHCYAILRRLTAGPSGKTIDMRTARGYIALLLLDRFPQHAHPLIAYMTSLIDAHAPPRSSSNAGSSSASTSSRAFSPPPPPLANDLSGPRMTYDQWSCLIDWCLSVHPHTLEGYDSEGSWPVFFDDFVGWLCRRAPGVGRDASAGVRAQDEAAAAAAAKVHAQSEQQHRQSGADSPARASTTTSNRPFAHSRLQMTAEDLGSVVPLDADLDPSWLSGVIGPEGFLLQPPPLHHHPLQLQQDRSYPSRLSLHRDLSTSSSAPPPTLVQQQPPSSSLSHLAPPAADAHAPMMMSQSPPADQEMSSN